MSCSASVQPLITPPTGMLPVGRAYRSCQTPCVDEGAPVVADDRVRCCGFGPVPGSISCIRARLAGNYPFFSFVGGEKGISLLLVRLSGQFHFFHCLARMRSAVA